MTDWEVRANLVPISNFLGSWLQIFFSSPTLSLQNYFGVDYNRETIKGNRQFNIFYVILLQSSISEELISVCNVSFTRAELLKTTTSPRHAYCNPNLRIYL